jgi:hypothetical protein
LVHQSGWSWVRTSERGSVRRWVAQTVTQKGRLKGQLWAPPWARQLVQLWVLLLESPWVVPMAPRWVHL